METATDTQGKQAISRAGANTPARTEGSGDLLSRAHFGLHVTGRVDAITPLTHRQGKAKSGNDYSFYQQNVSISVGGEMYEIAFRQDNAPPNGKDIVLFDLDDKVKIKVGNPRLFNGKVAFDAVMEVPAK